MARASQKMVAALDHNRGYMPIGTYPWGSRHAAKWGSKPPLAVMSITFLTLPAPIWQARPLPAGRRSPGALQKKVRGLSPILEYQDKSPWNAACRDIGALDKAFPWPDTAGTISSILSWSSALSARGRYDV
jgi:hypothetical protein